MLLAMLAKSVQREKKYWPSVCSIDCTVEFMNLNPLIVSLCTGQLAGLVMSSRSECHSQAGRGIEFQQKLSAPLWLLLWLVM